MQFSIFIGDFTLFGLADHQEVVDAQLDTDYDGRSDHLERQVDGRGTNDPVSVVLSRLGYWPTPAEPMGTGK